MKTERIWAVIFLLIVPTIAHLLFSGLGFNPTDDGFTLAYSRRILDGQIPHRDFIIIRPLISPLVHVPFVAFGGEYTFWLSRWFVWFELAGIAFLWVSIINRLLERPFGPQVGFLAAMISFGVSTHSFPIMAWHTIDGLLFAALGVWLVVRGTPGSKVAGYALVGIGYLCKQNFILLVPLTMAILGDWRRAKYWVAAAMPGVLYAGYVFATGAASDALLQLSSQTDLLSTGVFKYFRRWMPVGALIAAGAVSLLLNSAGKRSVTGSFALRRWLGCVGLYVVPIGGTAVSLATGDLYKSSFVLFGWGLGLAIYATMSRETIGPYARRALWLALAGAWCVSISEGYNSPVLMAGPLTVLLLAADQIIPRLAGTVPRRSAVVLGAAILITSGFAVGRYTHIYREQSAGRLTQSLDTLLPGGRLIRTNPNTWAYLDDLREMIQEIEERGKIPVVLPGVAALSVKSPQFTPLPIDWAQETELNRKELVDRVIGALERQRRSLNVIVQKVSAKRLADGFTFDNDLDRNEVIRWVRKHFTKAGETRWHEIYE